MTDNIWYSSIYFKLFWVRSTLRYPLPRMGLVAKSVRIDIHYIFLMVYTQRTICQYACLYYMLN